MSREFKNFLDKENPFILNKKLQFNFFLKKINGSFIEVTSDEKGEDGVIEINYESALKYKSMVPPKSYQKISWDLEIGITEEGKVIMTPISLIDTKKILNDSSIKK